jgi:hypothetical protein
VTPLRGPARTPCVSCPYRRDVLSGLWAQAHYERLPHYDGPTATQPGSVFSCHQQNGKVCAGWAGCHDMEENLGVRFAAQLGILDERTLNAVRDYVSPVPLFDSGQEACDHGLADIENPSPEAVTMMGKIVRNQRRRRAAAVARTRKDTT